MKIFISILVVIVGIGALFILLKTDSTTEVAQTENEPVTDTNDSPSSEAESNTDTTAVATVEVEQLLGTWVSQDDANFTRTFTDDGVVIDTYQESATTSSSDTGSWSVATTTPSQFSTTDFAETSALIIDFPTMGEPLYFPITILTDTELEMINASGVGNVLRFQKEL